MSLNSYFYFLLDSTYFFLYLLMMNLYIELDTIGWWNVSYGVAIIKAHRLHPLIFINEILIQHSFGYFLRWLSWEIETNCEKLVKLWRTMYVGVVSWNTEFGRMFYAKKIFNLGFHQISLILIYANLNLS